jgi:prepilin-type N-terminal cleavage/methylation domain-containing protein
MNRNFKARANRGFTIVELVVVVTIIGLLAAIAVGAYNKVVNDAKTVKAAALINTLSTAKSLFVADPQTTEAMIVAFNGGDFSKIAKYIRVNGAIPTDLNTSATTSLLALSQLPTTVNVTLGTVEDDNVTPAVLDSPPTVTGYP